MASILKRNDSYRITVNAGIDSAGKQIRQSTTYRPTATTPRAIEKEVEAFAKEFEERVRTGKYLSGEKVTFNDVYEMWKESYGKVNLFLGTFEGYCRYLDAHAVKHFGTMPISKVSAMQLTDIINDLHRSGLSVESLKRIKTAFNSVFDFAFRLNIIYENPVNRIIMPKKEKNTLEGPVKRKHTKLHVFNPEQVKRYLEATTMTFEYEVKGSTNKVKATGQTYTRKPYIQKKKVPTQFESYFYLALYGGFRRGEMIGLKWRDIDFKNCTVNIERAVAHTKSKGDIQKAPKTESGYRKIALPKVCFDVLRRWYDEEKLLYLKLGTAWNDGNRPNDFNDCDIFIQDNGKRMCVSTPTHKFKEVLHKYNELVEEDLKLPEIRLHDLRHTNATLSLVATKDYESVSHRLGHAQTSTTIDIYGHSLEEIDVITSNKFAELIG